MKNHSACIDMLFCEDGDTDGDRIRKAAAYGFDAVEFWGWTKRDLDDVESALKETGVKLLGIMSEPKACLTDPSTHDEFLEGLKASVQTAQRLGATVLIAQSGDELDGVPRDQQNAAITDCLKRSVQILKGTGVTLTLEPLNDRVDHPGYYLTSTKEGLDIIDAVAQPEVKLLYDIYHSAVMDEVTEDVLAGRVDRIAHVHLADHPGRHEPGSGQVDWQHRVNWVQQNGYSGYIGLEYRPSGQPSPVFP